MGRRERANLFIARADATDSPAGSRRPTTRVGGTRRDLRAELRRRSVGRIHTDHDETREAGSVDLQPVTAGL